MAGKSKKRVQLLINDIDPKVLVAIKKIAVKERRSKSRTAERLLEAGIKSYKSN